jgi:hypothetical protein
MKTIYKAICAGLIVCGTLTSCDDFIDVTPKGVINEELAMSQPEEMVTAAETIVNAEVRLDHLRSGCNEPLHNTREIAVITRVEGLTWLKHSLYAL